MRTELKNFAELFCWPKWVWPEVQKQKHMAQGTGELRQGCGFTHKHPRTLTQKHTHTHTHTQKAFLLVGQEIFQTLQIRKDTHGHSESEIFQEHSKHK